MVITVGRDQEGRMNRGSVRACRRHRSIPPFSSRPLENLISASLNSLVKSPDVVSNIRPLGASLLSRAKTSKLAWHPHTAINRTAEVSPDGRGVCVPVPRTWEALHPDPPATLLRAATVAVPAKDFGRLRRRKWPPPGPRRRYYLGIRNPIALIRGIRSRSARPKVVPGSSEFWGDPTPNPMMSPEPEALAMAISGAIARQPRQAAYSAASSYAVLSRTIAEWSPPRSGCNWMALRR
jgi:hypothetical protein